MVPKKRKTKTSAKGQQSRKLIHEEREESPERDSTRALTRNSPHKASGGDSLENKKKPLEIKPKSTLNEPPSVLKGKNEPSVVKGKKYAKKGKIHDKQEEDESLSDNQDAKKIKVSRTTNKKSKTSAKPSAGTPKTIFCIFCDGKIIKGKNAFLTCQICNDYCHKKCSSQGNPKDWICGGCKLEEDDENDDEDDYVQEEEVDEDDLEEDIEDDVKKPRGKAPISYNDFPEICVTCGFFGPCNCDDESLSSPLIYSSESDYDDEIIEIDDQEEEAEEIIMPIPSAKSVLIIESDSDSSAESFEESSDESSVYEEPENESEKSDEDLITDIVREKLLNGWSDSNEEFSDDEEDEFNILKQETAAIKADLDARMQGEMKKIKESPEKKKSPVLAPIKTAAPIVKVENTTISPSQPTHTAAAANPWLALAAMRMKNRGFINTNSVLANPLLAAAALRAKSVKVQQPILPTAPSTSSTLFNQPAAAATGSNTNASNAAAALMSNPAAFKAFSELLRRGMNKSQNSTGKPKKTVGVPSNLKKELVVENSQKQTKRKHVEEEPEIDEDTLFEDIFDNGRFQAGSRSPSPPGMEFEYEISKSFKPPNPKLSKIPLGTFWKSQRNGSKESTSKRKDIQHAIKTSSDFKVLDSTLFENMPKQSKRHKRRGSHHSIFFSPILFATPVPGPDEFSHGMPSQSLEFLDQSPSIPPPFLL